MRLCQRSWVLVITIVATSRLKLNISLQRYPYSLKQCDGDVIFSSRRPEQCKDLISGIIIYYLVMFILHFLLLFLCLFFGLANCCC